MTKILTYETTGLPVTVGDIVETFRGESVKVRAVYAPHKDGSTGRVRLSWIEGGWEQECFPGVIGAEWRAKA